MPLALFVHQDHETNYDNYQNNIKIKIKIKIKQDHENMNQYHENHEDHEDYENMNQYHIKN